MFNNLYYSINVNLYNFPVEDEIVLSNLSGEEKNILENVEVELDDDNPILYDKLFRSIKRDFSQSKNLDLLSTYHTVKNRKSRGQHNNYAVNLLLRELKEIYSLRQSFISKNIDFIYDIIIL